MRDRYGRWMEGKKRVVPGGDLCGTPIGLGDVQPGDLVFYSNNGAGIGHVGIYIGGGNIVHAVSEAVGVQVYPMYYKTPCAATRILP